ncbi:MAG: DNA-processing protein DprA [Cytophagaceae bacterium]
MNQANIYEVAIGLIPGIGNYLTRQLISYCGSAEQVFRENKGKLKKIPGIGINLAESIINQNILGSAEKEIKLAEKNKTQLIFYTHKDYPERLRQIPDAPALLYYKGNHDLNPSRAVAIVGTRKATNYGKQAVEMLVEECKKLNAIVISGLAYGIDISAHKACLQQKISTIGVMANGMNHIYPTVHKETAFKMTEAGGILTEYSFDMKADTPFFPARNRIIAGLSDAVIVVEAAEKGGALITAEIANGYNREVFAVPGNIDQEYSKGCNKLIREHKATILSSPTDLALIMNWSADGNQSVKKDDKLPKRLPDLNAYSTEEATVIQSLFESEGILIDDLSWKSQLPLNKLASILLKLEFEGMVKSLPGKKYKLN